ncbi:hypothetical protein ACH5RR_008647 [Cinchona calisaya]|uniref:RNase H type-1 domain-containing protein n=1 Tax=Cinchona calisaya TaxID=153742 RepID=A0ABD3ABY7_9GENT
MNWFLRTKVVKHWIISSMALKCYSEYQSRVQQSSLGAVSRQVTRWQTRPAGELKINFDVAVFKQVHCCGIRVVIRDRAGKFVVGLSEKLHDTVAPKLAEILAARRSSGAGAELNLRGLSLEGGAFLVINQLNSLGEDLSILGPVSRMMPGLD